MMENQAKNGTIKAVIFDIGGVFVPLVFKPIFEDLEARYHLQPFTIYTCLLDSGENGPFQRLERGEINETQFGILFGDFVSAKVGKKVDVTQLMVEFEARKLKRSVSAAMHDAVRCIRAEGLQTAVLTNNWTNFSGRTNIQVDADLFDVIIESCKVGLRKPDPRIYTLVLKKLGVEPHEAVFVDDLFRNTEAASHLGIHPLLFQDEDQCLSDLEKILGFSVRGYMEGTTSVPIRLRFNEDNLRSYMETSLGMNDNEPPTVRCYSHGQSNPTYFVRYAGKDMVLRKKPPGTLLPSAHAVEREYRVMKAVHGQGVPVPKPICLCEDSTVIGTPFYIMEHVRGRIFMSSLLPDMTKMQRREIYREMCRTLVKIHSVDLAKAGLESYGKTDGRYMMRNFERWYSQYDASRTGTEPALMEDLSDWLRTHLPTKNPTALIHGDFRLDNLIFHPERLEVVAVLDWELSTLGDPQSDLAHVCMGYYTPDGVRMGGVTGLVRETALELGIPTVEEYVHYYCQQTGLKSLPKWAVYVAFVFFRMAAISQGVYKRFTIGQASSPTAELSGAAVEFLAQLGLDALKTAQLSDMSKL